MTKRKSLGDDAERAFWDEQMEKDLVDTFLVEVRNGKRAENGFKKESYSRVAHFINEEAQSLSDAYTTAKDKRKDHYQCLKGTTARRRGERPPKHQVRKHRKGGVDGVPGSLLVRQQGVKVGMEQRPSVDGVSVSRYLLVVFTVVIFELDFRNIWSGRNRFGNGSALTFRLLTECQYDVERGSFEVLVILGVAIGGADGFEEGMSKREEVPPYPRAVGLRIITHRFLHHQT
ncbi:hypothetical protein P167DRAFT_545648 [Morchella conica CCBAS932]|uniref:Myb/SANT-like domain-containing protein n=1 Tax=Morchella conica CCBAS932 TaxID=1392247 RepID=A0A3N4KSZ9_9PEZI|nr:hypothetical protein P167DRAFT_545648 [Morchella conica CCBAS932]